MAIPAVIVAIAVVIDDHKLVVGACIVFAALVSPHLAAVGISAVGLWLVIGRRKRPVKYPGDDALLADLTALGLSAGLTFPAAAQAAASSVEGDAAIRLSRALRFRGVADQDPTADPALMVVARRALSTGAPLIPAVSGFATRLRSEERSRQLTAARRLPVKLLFPLALLILPGFLILTIGPAVLGSLERLGL